LEKLFWPTGFSVLYPYSGVVALTTPDIAISAVLVIVLLITVIVLRTWTRFPFAAFLFFLVTLVPTFVNFSKGGNLYVASDRYTYLPSLGIFLLIATIGVVFWESRTGAIRTILNCVLALVLAVFCVLSFQLTKVWASSEVLFRNVLKYYPNSYAAHNNIGNVLRRRNDLDGAIVEFKAALASWDHPKVRSNLGAVYAKKGMAKEAEEQFAAAEKLDPKSAEPDFGKGILYASLGQPDKALAAYARALQKDPTFSIAYVNRGSLLLDLGRRAEAEADFRKAIEIEPYLAQAHFNLAVLDTRDGNLEDAITHYEDVVSMQPYFTQARMNLGALYAKVGKLKEAKRQFLAILDSDPNNVAAQSAIDQIETVERSY
jgi:Flp pilus assembly protein TadD